MKHPFKRDDIRKSDSEPKANSEFEAASASESLESLSLSQLCDYVEGRYHAYARREMPRLIQLTERVAQVHGFEDPRLQEIYNLFCQLANELAAHLTKEERILFPMIRALEDGEAIGPGCVGVDGPIRQMLADHQEMDAKLNRIADLADHFRIPDHSCNTYRTMLYGMAGFYEDYFEHSDVEERILFSAAQKKAGNLSVEMGEI